MNHRVRKVSNGIISTVAGTGKAQFAGDGGAALSASLNYPVGLAMTASGDLFIADRDNFRVRKVSNGIISTVAGTSTAGFSGDSAPATSAQLNQPAGIDFSGGNLYISDFNNNRIRVLLANGTIWTAAGNGSASFSGDGGSATSAALFSPRTVAADPSGSIYIADFGNQRIRMLSPTGPITLAPPSVTSVESASAFGGSVSAAPGTWIEIYGSNLATGTRSWGASDFNGVNAPTSLDGTSVSIGGQAAFVDYISPGQVNALIPSTAVLGNQSVTVTMSVGTIAAKTMSIAGFQPGMLAPSSFAIGGKQYVTGLFADGTYALQPGAISGINSRLPKPGDTVTLYGIGFGSVVPSLPAGQLEQQNNSLTQMLQISIGGMPVTIYYAGLAPGFTGLYQFNVQIPAIPANIAAPITFTLNSVARTQTLYLPIGN